MDGPDEGVNEKPAVPKSNELASSVFCPHCEAELKNVRSEAGQALRCLNCGKRFFPAGTAAVAQNAPTAGPVLNFEEATPQRPTLPLREVKTPGYWLLRIPAIVFLAVTCVVGAITFFSMLPMLWMKGGQSVLFLAYIPLWPVAGLFAYWFATSFSKIDAGMARMLECQRPGASDLPSVEGSSLPYILPMAVFGGVLPILGIVSMNEGRGGDEWMALYPILGGFAIFVGAFSLEDVRQFLWRQREYCLRFAGSPDKPARFARVQLGVSSLMLCIAVFSAGMFWGALNSRSRDSLLMLGIGVAYLGMAYSFGLLDRNFMNVLANWVRYRRGSQAELVRDEYRIPGVNEPPFFWNARAAIGAVAAALSAVFIVYWLDIVDPGNQYYYGRPRLSASLFTVLFVIAPMCGVTFNLVSRRMRRLPSERGYFLRLLSVLPLLLVMGLWAYWIVSVIDGGTRFYNSEQLIAICLAGCGMFFAALWMNEILIRVSLWREVLEGFPFVGGSGSTMLKGYQSLFLRLITGMVIVQVGLFSTILLPEARDIFQFLAMVAMLVAVHAPTIWLAMLLNEVWNVERVVNRRVEVESL